MNHYIEYTPGGRILMSIRAPEPPLALMGGTVVQVDAEVDPKRFVYRDDALVDLGPPEVPELPLAVRIKALVDAIQRELDAGARLRQYDDIKSALSYRGDPNPLFAAEAEAYFQWRSAVWTSSYAYLARVEAGEVPLPPIEQVIAMLPPLVLPDR